MVVQLKRDSFARATLYRDILGVHGREDCKWCGKPFAKFIYGWEDDGIYTSVSWDGPFCSVGCYRIYHGQDML